MPPLVSPDFKFIESLADAAIIVNGSGVILLANPRAEAMFGYLRGELTGQSVQVLVPEAARGLHPIQVERYFTNPRVRNMGSGLKLFGRRRDGSEFPVDIALSPLHEGDKLFTLGMIRAVDTSRERRTSPLDGP